MALNITLDRERERFVANVEGQPCSLDFRQIDDNRMEYYRTFVPEDLRNRGIASKLVKYALDYAESNDIKIIPTCDFVKDYIDKHDEYKKLLAEK